MKSLEGVPNVKTKIINIKNEKKLISALKGIDYVFHLAGVSDLHKAYINPKKTAEFNIIGTINVLDACVKNKVKKIIFSSSLYSFTEEGGFYKSSKLSVMRSLDAVSPMWIKGKKLAFPLEILMNLLSIKVLEALEKEFTPATINFFEVTKSTGLLQGMVEALAQVMPLTVAKVKMISSFKSQKMNI